MLILHLFFVNVQLRSDRSPTAMRTSRALHALAGGLVTQRSSCVRHAAWLTHGHAMQPSSAFSTVSTAVLGGAGVAARSAVALRYLFGAGAVAAGSATLWSMEDVRLSWVMLTRLARDVSTAAIIVAGGCMLCMLGPPSTHRPASTESCTLPALVARHCLLHPSNAVPELLHGFTSSIRSLHPCRAIHSMDTFSWSTPSFPCVATTGPQSQPQP